MTRSASRIAVIGAGMAGLACARDLGLAGFEVTVFEKSRGTGGRLATRRVAAPGGDLTFDHGAQFVTARDPSFRAELAALVQAGAAAPWDPAGPDPAMARGSLDAPRGPGRDGAAEPWYVGAPGMSGLVKPLAAGLAIETGVRAERLERGPDGWRVFLEEDQEPAGPFAALVLAIPAPQAAELLGERAAAFPALGAVRYGPCWAVMGALAEPLPWRCDAAKPRSEPLAWAARNGSKPGRAGGFDTWVLHASPAWSRAHLEDDPAWAAENLWDAFSTMVGAPCDPAYVAAHRWRYALVEAPAGADCLADEASGLALCGDWCIGPRVEAAYLSGRAAAARVAAWARG